MTQECTLTLFPFWECGMDVEGVEPSGNAGGKPEPPTATRPFCKARPQTKV